MYNEFLLTSRNYIRTVMRVQPEWLFEIAPEYFDLSAEGDFKQGEARRKLERILETSQRKK